jgi:glucose/arabinose dehydrogenase
MGSHVLPPTLLGCALAATVVAAAQPPAFTVAPSVARKGAARSSGAGRNDIYVLRYFSARGGKGPRVKKGYTFPDFPRGVGFLTPLIDVYGPEGRLKQSGIVTYLKQGACGVRVDRDGSIYVADHIKPKGVTYHLSAARVGRSTSATT